MRLARFFVIQALIVALLLTYLFVLSPLTNKVEAATAEPEQRAEQVYTCYSWRNRSGTIQAGTPGVGPTVFVNYTVRYNGCGVYALSGDCSALTSLVSVRNTWCGFYQPAHWNRSHIHVGSNHQLCTSPIGGVGVCWNEYVRGDINKDGLMTSIWGSAYPYLRHWYR